MVYLLLGMAALFGLFGLYRFFMNATIPQIKSFFMVLLSVVLAASLFYMAITGRLAAAIGLITVSLPIALGYLRQIRMMRKQKRHAKSFAGGEDMSCKKALDILGLKDGATEQDIEAAYKKLMKKIHPDQEGTAWLASQINQAHDFLKKRD